MDWMRMKEVWTEWMETETPLHQIAAILREKDEETQQTRFAWLYDNVDTLNLEYFSRSAEKIITPLVLSLLEKEDRDERLAKVIINRYANRWIKLADLYSIKYDPIENYSSVEETTYGHKVDRTPIKKETETVKTNMDTTTEITSDQGNQRYGFNSTEAVNTDKAKDTQKQHQTANEDSNRTTREYTREGDEVETHSGTDTFKRSGNIGVTTSQQMLESEIDLWTKWDFLSEFYRDIDSILCLSIY